MYIGAILDKCANEYSIMMMFSTAIVFLSVTSNGFEISSVVVIL